MSSHASTKIDQKEYLKRYLSGDKVKKKKKDKKRKKEVGGTKVRIIDDDAACNQTQEEFDEELILGGEDAPQIVGEYIEEQSSNAKAPKWRSIVIKDEPDQESEMGVERNANEDLWGPKQIKREIKDEFSPPRRHTSKRQNSNTPDNSQQRQKSYKNQKSLKSDSPIRNTEHTHSRREGKERHQSPDQSPQRRKTTSIYKQLNVEKLSSIDRSPPRRREQPLDNSPPRRRNYSPDQSPPRKSKAYTYDDSPSRGYQNNNTHKTRKNSEHSPIRKTNYSSNSRYSMDRSRSPAKPSSNKREHSSDRKTHKSNHKRNGKSSSSDQSPPRKFKHTKSKRKSRSVSSDQSPPRRRNRDLTSSDQSPPRKLKNKSNTNRRKSRSRSVDQSPQRRIKREPSSDQSPPRRRIIETNRKRSVSPRQNNYRKSRDQSPPRRYNGNSQSSNSPTRIKREKNSPNLSPPRVSHRNIKKEYSSSPPPTHSRWSKNEQRGSDSPPPTHKPKATKTLDGKKAGLQNAKSLVEETEERRRREDRMYKDMSKEISGRDAEVRVRSTGRKGQRARDAEAEDPEVRKRKEEHERKKKEKYDRWGKGLKQVEEYRQRTEAESYEGSKPLARYENDEDLDKYLREQERAEDPMLEYMRKKKKERQKEQGALAEMPKYEGSYPENRFSIRPATDGTVWTDPMGLRRSGLMCKMKNEHDKKRRIFTVWKTCRS
ncbi:unnamed protein product [Ceratitis capitata]|uniref:BUD13 homolog n=1 Tax=Ceratitis capitata TaxID=7213 RepID=A0A811U0L6_CERCA|nr:unnamed protein product [Ceratitis capitata]